LIVEEDGRDQFIEPVGGKRRKSDFDLECEDEFRVEHDYSLKDMLSDCEPVSAAEVTRTVIASFGI
jgi:hypothetical protein